MNKMIHRWLFSIIFGLIAQVLCQLDNKLYDQNYKPQDNPYDQNNFLGGDKYTNFRNSNINSNYNLNDYGNDYRYNQNSDQFNQFNIDYRGPGTLNIDDYIEKSDNDQNSNGNCPKFWISYNPDSNSDFNRGGSYNDICFRFFISLKTRNEAFKVCQTYNVDLANIDTVKKHAFIIKHLIKDENHDNRYLISAKLINNQWINNDNTNLVNENIYPQDLMSHMENIDLQLFTSTESMGI
ncbi:contactin-like [Ctenocephalides felis]|uniref:contactin-like n=1 Tax=Ctenocephalides felis TaxID=7515 RepID=UPI000E6E21D1|nr:contactin-like [Ctenocephalides felis]